MTFCTIKVDNCLITSTGIKKCDCVIYCCNNSHYYFVELGGVNKISDIFDQLNNTINFFRNKLDLKGLPLPKENIHAYAIIKIPTKSSQALREVKERFMHELGLRLNVNTRDNVQISL